MGRPRIGISMSTERTGVGGEHRVLQLHSDYVIAVERAGGLPILLPHTHDAELRAEMISMLDGLLMPGGDDVNPAMYGQELHPTSVLMDELRQSFDFAMLSLAERAGLPVLGVCLGFQEMNVHRRGALHQNVSEALGDACVGHSRKKEFAFGGPQHEVEVHGGTRLHGLLGSTRVGVNSRHRQGVSRLGHGLVGSAWAEDGLIEGLEDPTLRFWVGVQWHPENMVAMEQTSVHLRLFEGLVSAAREYGAARGR